MRDYFYCHSEQSLLCGVYFVQYIQPVGSFGLFLAVITAKLKIDNMTKYRDSKGTTVDQSRCNYQVVNDTVADSLPNVSGKRGVGDMRLCFSNQSPPPTHTLYCGRPGS